jgi:hypothetical protein
MAFNDMSVSISRQKEEIELLEADLRRERDKALGENIIHDPQLISTTLTAESQVNTEKLRDKEVELQKLNTQLGLLKADLESASKAVDGARVRLLNEFENWYRHLWETSCT